MNRALPSWILLFVTLLLTLPSCREPKDLEFRDFKNLKVHNIGFSAAKLKVDLIYYNPNNFGLELNRTNLDLYIDSSFLGHSAQNIQVAIPKRDVFTIPLEIDLDMKNLLKNGLTAYMNKEVLVRAVGKVKVGKAGIYKNFNVDYSTRQTFSLFN
ncbi:MAG: LEA type 2 family protein [Ferruginibacter sp.]